MQVVLINEDGNSRQLCGYLVAGVSCTHDSAAGDITDDPHPNASMPPLSDSAAAWGAGTKEDRKTPRHGRLINIHPPGQRVKLIRQVAE